MKFFLDTNICIFLMNAKFPDMNTYYLTRNPLYIFISTVVLSELVYGVQKSKYRQQNFSKLEIFLSEIKLIPLDDRAATIAGQIRADMDLAGTPIGGNDILIAATVLTNQGLLVTNNTREFSQVHGLQLEDWTK